MIKIGILEDRKSYSDDLEFNIKQKIPNATIHAFKSVDNALEAIKQTKNWTVWIVDLMLPHGTKMTSLETKNGLATGTRFVDRLIEANVTISAGMFIVSSRETLSDKFSELDKTFEIFEIQKGDHTQIEIAEQIKIRIEATGDGN